MNNQVRFGVTPTSLDVINGPNPVEPPSFPKTSTRQGWVNRPQQEQAQHEHRRHRRKDGVQTTSLLNDFSSPHGSGGQISMLLNPEQDTVTEAEQSSRLDPTSAFFMLPRLSQQGVQRQQFPPVLQGLHQPPPNAGLLPSMSANVQSTYTMTGRDSLQASHGLFAFDDLDFSSAPAFSTEPRLHTYERDRFSAGDYSIAHSGNAVVSHDQATEPAPGEPAKQMMANHGLDIQTSELVAIERPADEASAPPAASKSKRRQRTKWSDEEDHALLAGLKRYGPSWSTIQIDPVLKDRTPTDIRDRIRLRFPDEYAKTGLVPKPARTRKRAAGAAGP